MKESSEKLQLTTSEVEPNKSFFSFSKKDKPKEFGYDREIAFNEEVKNSEELLNQCKENLWFEPHQWKENNIRWRSELTKLQKVTEAWAKIRIYRMEKNIEKKPEKRGFFKRLIFGGKSSGS